MNGEPEDTEEVKRARELEVQAVRAAEDGNLSHALELLNRAVVEAPTYASPYNNRAWVNSCLPSMRPQLSFYRSLPWKLLQECHFSLTGVPAPTPGRSGCS